MMGMATTLADIETAWDYLQTEINKVLASGGSPMPGTPDVTTGEGIEQDDKTPVTPVQAARDDEEIKSFDPDAPVDPAAPTVWKIPGDSKNVDPGKERKVQEIDNYVQTAQVTESTVTTGENEFPMVKAPAGSTVTIEQDPTSGQTQAATITWKIIIDLKTEPRTPVKITIAVVAIVDKQYAINVDEVTGGTVTTDPADKAAEGTQVTVTATPEIGYKLDTITVTDVDSGDVTVTDSKFTMPAKDVTVTATFVNILEGSKVEVLTGEDDGNAAEVSGQGKATVTVSPSGQLQYAEERQAGNGSTYRKGGWYVGISIYAPTGAGFSLENAKYRNNNDAADKSFTAYKDSTGDAAQHFITCWGGIFEDDVNNGTVKDEYTYTWYFNWDGDESTGNTYTVKGTEMKGVDQVISLTFTTSELKLMKNGQQVWPTTSGTGTTFIGFGFEDEEI